MTLKSFWQRLKYWQKGFLIGILVILCLLLSLILIAALNYDGECAGFPFLEASHKCSFPEHMMKYSPTIWVIYLPEFWYLSLIIVLITTLIGYYIDNKKCQIN